MHIEKFQSLELIYLWLQQPESTKSGGLPFLLMRKRLTAVMGTIKKGQLKLS